MVDSQHVLRHRSDPFGSTGQYARGWVRVSRTSAGASAGITIAAATTCVSASVSRVETAASANTSGTSDTRVSATVVRTKGRRGWCCRRARHTVSTMPTNERRPYQREAGERDRLAADGEGDAGRVGRSCDGDSGDRGGRGGEPPTVHSEGSGERSDARTGEVGGRGHGVSFRCAGPLPALTPATKSHPPRTARARNFLSQKSRSNVSSATRRPQYVGRWLTGTGKAQPKTRQCRTITPSSGMHCLTSSTSNLPARGRSMRAATVAASSGSWSIGAPSVRALGTTLPARRSTTPRRLAGERPLEFAANDTVPDGWFDFDVPFSHEVLYLLHDLPRHGRDVRRLRDGGVITR